MRIMLVSPAFPPFSGVGGVRMYSLANHLQNNGHDVIVIRNSINTWGKENCKSACNNFYKIVDVDFKAKDYYYGVERESIEAYKKTIKIILDTERVDIIIYSCGPYFNAITAVEIKKEYGIKTIIDYRDLWINEENNTRNVFKIIKRKLFKIPYWKYERESIVYADKIITVTPEECAVLQHKYKECASKITYIYNGYDDKRINGQDEINIKEYNLPERYVGVFGKFAYYDFNYTVELLKAIKRINESGINIKIVHVGKKESIDEKAIEKSGVPKGLYVNLGYLDYPVGIKVMEKAIAGCIILNYKRGLGTKVFDYIMLNKPIIYFAHKECAIDRLLKKAKNSFRCEKYTDALKALVKIYDDGITDIGMEEREQFSRINRNSQFEKIISYTVKQ